jgi:GNAT superfamily N-acetyltransferase
MLQYDIKHVTGESDLDRIIAFAEGIFKVGGGFDSSNYSKDAWMARIEAYAEFILYAESDGEVVGIAFGHVDENNNITVGPVASDERYRHCGIASSLLAELEKRVLAKGYHLLALGALEPAEGFYLKCGYTPFLLVQASHPLSLADLRSLNDRYDEAWSYDDGTDIRLCILTKGIDRELQHKYDAAFPGCSTQTMFTKYI